jgi:hypothetical protein
MVNLTTLTAPCLITKHWYSYFCGQLGIWTKKTHQKVIWSLAAHYNIKIENEAFYFFTMYSSKTPSFGQILHGNMTTIIKRNSLTFLQTHVSWSLSLGNLDHSLEQITSFLANSIFFEFQHFKICWCIELLLQIDALAAYGVAPIGRHEVLSTPHLEVWGKVKKNAISSRIFGISSNNFWVICGRKYHISPKSYLNKFRKFAKKTRFFDFSPYCEMGRGQHLLLTDRSDAMVR